MRIVIAGGQTKADFLIGMFKKNHHKLVVINDTPSYAEYLVQKHKIDVIVNDATSKAALADAGIENFDVLVALLPSDADKTAKTVRIAYAYRPATRRLPRRQRQNE